MRTGSSSFLKSPDDQAIMTSIPTLNQLSASLASGSTTAADLLEQAIARATDPQGEGRRVFIERYEEQARASARAADTLRAAGMRRSPIDGLPISIKDLFDYRGSITRGGSVVLDDAAPATANAVVVDRLLAAGAVIVGRTNMTEFAYSGLGINPHYDTPRNPWDRATGRIPGGSSSGAAVSVTDGMAAAAIGSDTGGSVRIPSALCGLTGFKPTARRVSMRGVQPLSASLDSIGPLAPSVACCAVLDAILAGEPIHVPQPAVLKGLRLAVPTTVALDGMDDTVSAVFARTIDRLRAAGALVSEIAVPAFARLAGINAAGGFTASQAWAFHRKWIAEKGDRYDPRVVSRIKRGEGMSAADYLDLLDARQAWIAEVDATLAPFDALVMPTVPVVAPAIETLKASDDAYYAANGAILRNPTLINFLDGCSLSLPCHAPGDTPVGLMISAPALADQRVLAIGLAIEAELS